MLSHLPAYHHHTASNMHHPSVSSASQFEPLIRPLIPRQNHVWCVRVVQNRPASIGQPLNSFLSLSLQMLSFTAPPFSLSRPSVGVVEHPIRIKPVEPKKKREIKKTLAPCRCLLLLEIGAIAKEKQQQETQDCCFVRVSPPRADPFCSAQPRDCARANLCFFFSTPSSSQGFLSHLQQRTAPSLLVGDGARHMSEILSHGAGRPRSCDFRSRM